MAIQNYIGWPIGVNKVILDSTTISIGENALRKDDLENGHQQSEQKSPYVPEKYQVKMSFDWVNEAYYETYDEQGNVTRRVMLGKTQYQLFTDWYKYQHKCGSIPFEFPKILYSSNTGIAILDNHNDVQYTEYYRITSSTEGAKSGEEISVTMTWETVYSGVVSITNPSPSVDHLSATSTYLDVFFDVSGSTAPVSSQFTVYKKPTGENNWTAVTTKGFQFDGNSVARIYFDELTGNGDLTVAISGYCSEAQGAHTTRY